MHPLEIPTHHTLTFILAHLPPPATILEVGAGDGRLAAALADAGHTVTAIDLDARCVAEARARDVNAHFANWLEYEPRPGTPPFDALLFSRSLHHISPLDDAVARAVDPRVLSPRAIIIVEDYAFTQIDRPTADWLASTLRTLTEAREIRPRRDSLPAKILVAPDPLRIIRRHRERHHIHTAKQIRASLDAHAAITHESTAPYLYRWIAAAADEPPPPSHATHAADLVEQILATEQRLIESGAIRPVGRRFIARPRA